MEIIIGKKIRQNRIGRSMTQDELAQALGVTFQTVSKWECGDCYPDITLLPVIANYFDITLDELLGMAEIRDEHQLQDTYRIVHEWEAAGRLNEAIQRLRQASRIWPNQSGLWSELALALTLQSDTDQNPALIQEAITLSERVLAGNSSEKCRSTTRANLLLLYLKAGAIDRATALVRTLPHIWESREMLLPELTNQPQYAEALKQAIVAVLSLLIQKVAAAGTHCLANAEAIIPLGLQLVDRVEIRPKTEALLDYLET